MPSHEAWRNFYDVIMASPTTMPSVDEPGVKQVTKQFEQDCYAARFEQDVLNAVERLGWARVNVIIDKCRED